MVAGILSGLCGIYWLIKTLFYEDTNLPAILSSIAIALFLTLYAQKRQYGGFEIKTGFSGNHRLC